MKITKEDIELIESNYELTGLHIKLLLTFFQQAHYIRGDGYITSYYFDIINTLIYVYSLGSNNVIPEINIKIVENDY
jgi:hypothetical protein